MYNNRDTYKVPLKTMTSIAIVSWASPFTIILLYCEGAAGLQDYSTQDTTCGPSYIHKLHNTIHRGLE